MWELFGCPKIRRHSFTWYAHFRSDVSYITYSLFGDRQFTRLPGAFVIGGIPTSDSMPTRGYNRSPTTGRWSKWADVRRPAGLARLCLALALSVSGRDKTTPRIRLAAVVSRSTVQWTRYGGGYRMPCNDLSAFHDILCHPSSWPLS